MEKFKGTPGPWRVSDDNYTFQHVAHDFYHQISAGCGYLNEREGMGFSLSGLMSIHDASLIAAAPELLEALQDMLGGWKYIREQHGDLYGVGWDRAQEKAEDAIKKALGETK